MHRFFLLSLPLLAAGCMGTVIPQELPVTMLAQGHQSMQTEERFEWVTQSETFHALWNTAQAAPPPSLDFERDGVVAVFMGERPTGGHSIQVERVALRDGELLVEVLLRSPGAGCLTTQALTQPYQMVSVPRVAEQAIFTTRTVLVPCR
jgi:hypothetical protein